MSWRFGASVLALGLVMAAPAWAGEKQDFEQCDGRIHPGRQDDGMRGEPNSPYFMRGFGTPAMNIAACDRALASARLLPTQALRRAHLLRARAAKHLQQSNPAAALTDIAAARSAVPERAGDPFFQRSMGVSLDLLQGIALVQSGQAAEARRLALQAMAARPYSVQVQRLGAEIMHAAGPVEGAASPWTMIQRLEPAAGAAVLMREAEAGNFAGVVALRPGVQAQWPKDPPNPLSLLLTSNDGFLATLLVNLNTAYARAATGDVAGARRDLADVRTHIAVIPPAKAPAADLIKVVQEVVATHAKRVEARIAVAEQRPSDAIAAMVGSSFPKDAATLELLTSLKASAPAKDAAMIPALDEYQAGAGKDRTDGLKRLVTLALIAPETPRAVIDYSQSRPNILAAVVGGALSMGTSLLGGISRTDGFRSTVNPDGTTKVEFMGNTPSSALVQEMTLLRAAELARAANKTSFVVTDRKDYQRLLQMSRGGIPMSSTPQGFKTEMTIRYLDDAKANPRALDATAVIDALGPLYYEEKAAKTAAKS